MSRSKSQYTPSLFEVLPMTMQVGMVGTDGVLLASDTCCTDAVGVRHTFNSTKIRIDYDRKIAVSGAWDLVTARRIADAIFSDLQGIDSINSKDIEKIALDVCAPSIGTTHVECLVALSAPSTHLFHLEIDGSLFSCEERRDKGIAGDRNNAALFFMQRYYQRLPIKQLVPLAAHLIVSARLLNPGSFAGLEIVLCDAHGIQHIPDASIHDLELRAERWDKTIRDMLFSKRVHLIRCLLPELLKIFRTQPK